MPTHRLQYLVWNVGCKPQKNMKSKKLSSGQVIAIKKRFKRWDVEEILELSSDGMEYVVIENKLMEPLREM